MALGDVARDGEAEAGVALVLIARVIEPVERLEHVGALVRRDAGAVVVDLDAQPLALGGAADDIWSPKRAAFETRLTMARLNACRFSGSTSSSRRLRSLSSIGVP